jgi:hypothetical protein
MVLLAPSSESPEVVKQFQPPAPGGAKYQAPFADANDRWLVWAEGSKGISLIDWTIYLYDRLALTNRKIAEAALDPDGHPVPTQWVQPRIDHDTLVWSAGTAEPTLGMHVDCFLAPAAEGPVEVLVHDCKNPVISWPFVLYNKHLGAENEPVVELTFMDLRTRQAHSFRGLRNVPYYALRDGLVVWSDSEAKVLHLGSLEGSDDTVLADVRKGPADYVQFPAISDRLVSWGQNKKSGLYDMKLKARVVLDDPSRSFGFVYLNRNTLAWAEAPLEPPALRIRMINVRELP